MPRRPPRNLPRGRDAGRARPHGRDELGYISPDGSAGRRKPLPAWLPEAPDPPVRAEESGVRLIPIDEEVLSSPVSHVHQLEPEPEPESDPTEPVPVVPPAVPAPAAAAPSPSHAPTPPPAAPAAPAGAAPRSPGGTLRRPAPYGSAGVTIVAPPAGVARPEPPESVVDAPDRAAAGPATGARRRPRRGLGVSIDGGVAYLGVVEAPDRVRLDTVERLAPTAELETSAALEDFSRQVARLLRDLDIDTVGIARPLRYANWRYSDAFARVSLETCIMLEASRQSLRFESVGQQHASNVLGVPAERLSETLATKLGVERSAGWSNRCPALLVALAIASEAAARF